jgi:hypothetical protein
MSGLASNRWRVFLSKNTAPPFARQSRRTYLESLNSQGRAFKGRRSHCGSLRRAASRARLCSGLSVRTIDYRRLQILRGGRLEAPNHGEHRLRASSQENRNET